MTQVKNHTRPAAPLVSVIIPAYNAADTVGNTLRSVMGQSYRNLEIIVVDDGSTDNTAAVAGTAAGTDLRVRLIVTGHVGPGRARNIGLEQCSPQSRYVMFADADDFTGPEYVASMVARAGSGRLVVAPAVSSPAQLSVSDQTHIWRQPWSNPGFIKWFETGAFNSVWAKCYDLDVIRRQGIRFPDSLPEDTRFNLAYCSHITECISIGSAQYAYIHRSDSVTGKPCHALFDNYRHIQTQLLALLPADKAASAHRYAYLHYRHNACMYIAQGLPVPDIFFSDPGIRAAIRQHRPTGIRDLILHTLLQCRRLHRPLLRPLITGGIIHA